MTLHLPGIPILLAIVAGYASIERKFLNATGGLKRPAGIRNCVTLRDYQMAATREDAARAFDRIILTIDATNPNR